MNDQDQTVDLIEQLRKNPPKVIGGYKKEGWALKVLEKTSNEKIEVEPNGNITAKSVIKANDGTFYPAFLTLDLKKDGQVIGAYLLKEAEEQFDLIPFESAKEFTGKHDSDLLPLKYRTLEKIEGDSFQVNWPDFS